MKINFVGVGPQKTATTWLHHVLSSHSEICFPHGVKETFYWDKRAIKKPLNWYYAHFMYCDKMMIMGEIAPSYFHSEETRRRIYEHNPECKIIITLRDPVDRAFSLYLHQRKRGRAGVSFDKAVERWPEILDASHYKRHIEAWVKLFGKENVLLLLQEDIGEKPQAVIERVCRFLGLEFKTIKLPIGKVNEASLPTYPLLALGASKLADLIRSFKFYWIIEAGKMMGLKRIYGSNSKNIPIMDASLREKLLKEFASEIDYIEKLKRQSLD
jgi:hypothetical protein